MRLNLHQLLRLDYFRLIQMYKWLESLINSEGAMVDKSVRSSLDFQYQIPWFILSSSILNKSDSKKKYLDNINITLNYLFKIGFKVNKRSNSFITIPLLLSLIFISDKDISKKINEYVQRVKLYPSYNSTSSANNFFLLKMLSLLLKKSILDEKLNNDELEYISLIESQYIPQWQYEDGFFYDTPFKQNNHNGIPHLTYHASITMTVIFCAVIQQNSSLLDRGLKGLHVMNSMISPTGEAFAYGRSNNAIFGYSSAIFAQSLIISAVPENKKTISSQRKILFDHLEKNVNNEGFYNIVPNSQNKKRSGFDQYMFVSVYESWSLGLLLLSHLLEPFE